MTLNDNVRYADLRSAGMELAKRCKAHPQLLPLELRYPGLKIVVVVEKIVSDSDTKPLRYDEDEQRAD